MRFSELEISPTTVNALRKMSYHEMTEVQEKAIPLTLQGKEVIVRSKTGSGKTAAFGIGLIESITRDASKKALILAPTRELVMQITKELKMIASGGRIKIVDVYGGASLERQIRALQQGYDIVVATPGRLLDHYRRRSIQMQKFNLIVLDEADRMLDMGFRDDINDILSYVSKQRHMQLFSATMSRDVIRIAESHMHDPAMIEIGEEEKAEEIEEEMLHMARRDKFEKLLSILNGSKGRILIFAATQQSVEYIGKKLGMKRRDSNYLHGGMRQPKREKIMQDFKMGKIKILVATDVASRGLHIDDIEYVINYDEARDADTHLHRIGRTGRMGKKGKAVTFVETDRSSRGRGGGYGGGRGGGRGRFSGHSDNDQRSPRRKPYGSRFVDSSYSDNMDGDWVIVKKDKQS